MQHVHSFQLQDALVGLGRLELFFCFLLLAQAKRGFAEAGRGRDEGELAGKAAALPKQSRKQPLDQARV